MELPAMAEGLLLEEEEEEQRTWEPPVRNLDKFFTSMYHYYNQKGLPTIILTQFCAVATLGFTTVFSILLIGFFDWGGIGQCHDEMTCKSLKSYFHSPFENYTLGRNLFLILYSVLLTTYWLWRGYHAVYIVNRAIQMEAFYREKLGIRLVDLQSMRWYEVVQRLIKLHDHGIHRVAIKDKLTEHDVVLRIMRKDNYMIGFINKHVLDLKVPWWIAPFICERLFLTKSLEWSLSFCIMEYMFNEQFNISSLFMKDVQGLQGRFVMVGIVHIALLPFMLIFMIVSFFLQNAQQFHSSRAYLGPRQWSPLALWTFREFNELPHVFEERINKAYVPANEYIALFHNINAAVVARCAAYVAGSFVAILLLLSVFAEGVLLYVDVGEHNLLWWLGIFSALYAASRSVIPDATKQTLTHEELVSSISASTHYYPAHWANNAHTTRVKDEMAELFPFKINVFAMEVLSVVLTPLVLCFSLPRCAPQIIEFVRDHSRYVEGVGAVCDYSLFDFDRYGDERFGAPADGCVEASQRPEGGKMEQSYLNFQQAHPQWDGGDRGGRAFAERIHIYRAAREAERENMILQSLQQSLAPGGFTQMATTSIMKESTVVGPSAISSPINGQQNGKRATSGEDSESHLPVNSPAVNAIPSPPSGADKVVWGPQGFNALDSPMHMQSNSTHASMRAPNTSNGAALGTPLDGRPPKPSPLMNQSMQASQNMYSRGLSHGPGIAMGGTLASTTMNPLTQGLSGGQGQASALLRSVLRQENIDFENDFYWLTQFRQERARDPTAMERSLQHSMSLNLGAGLGFQGWAPYQTYGTAASTMHQNNRSQLMSPERPPLAGQSAGSSAGGLDLGDSLLRLIGSDEKKEAGIREQSVANSINPEGTISIDGMDGLLNQSDFNNLGLNLDSSTLPSDETAEV